jgi:nitronate monooxygenase
VHVDATNDRFAPFGRGYLSAERFAAQLAELRGRTTKPFGVNLFLPPTTPRSDREQRRRDAAVEHYGRRLAPEATRSGSRPCAPRAPRSSPP